MKESLGSESPEGEEGRVLRGKGASCLSVLMPVD